MLSRISAKRCQRPLELNAAAMLLAHNYSSWVVQPSRPDEPLSQAIRSAQSLVDMQLLDHFIVVAGLL
ncbi:JAB domain-containing protein [Variovorax sp. ZS18.2.2]|uniref:JAB domain-containing protein n=1 Tax=Variovorax sp. ZS18.2.2 TaxID=2971255 RepID=UPI0035B03C30